MTDKERLEEIDVVHYEEDEEGNRFALLKEDDYWFLLEQAEQAQELEGNESQVSTLKRLIATNLKPENDRLREQNKRLREAIEIAVDALGAIK